VKRILRVPGGKAANVAVAMARVLGPGRSALVGALGQDQIRELQLEAFRREGVDTRGVVTDPTVESGQAYILVDSKGQNVISTYFGANSSLKPQLLETSAVKDIVESVRFVVVMDTPLDFAEALLRKAALRGVPRLWAPGVRTLRGKKAVSGLLKHVDYFVLNEQELLNISGVSSIKEGFKVVLSNNPDLSLIVTLGKEGALLLSKGVEVKEEGLNLSAVGMRAVNTVGCGDAFIGCFAAQTVLDKPPAEALRLANHAGAFKATRLETRGSPTASELASFVSKFASLGS